MGLLRPPPRTPSPTTPTRSSPCSISGDVAFEHGALEGVAVDQHRRLQRLEAGDTHRVEDPRPGMAEVDLTGGDGAHDLLLGIGGEPPHSLTTSMRTLPPERSFTRLTKSVIAGNTPGCWRCWPFAGPPAHRTRRPCRRRPRRRCSPRHDGRDHGEGNVASLIRPFIRAWSHSFPRGSRVTLGAGGAGHIVACPSSGLWPARTRATPGVPQSRGDAGPDPAGDPGAAGRRAGRARPRLWCPGRRAGPGQVHHLRWTLRPGRHAHRRGRVGAGRGRPGHRLRPPGGRIGDLAVLAGLVWFAPVWVGWDRGPPLVRSLGMLAAGFTFPLLLHLVSPTQVAGCRGGRPDAGGCRLPGGRGRRARPSPLRDPSSTPTAGPTAATTCSCCARSRALPARSRWWTAGSPWLPRPRWWRSAPGGCCGTRGRLAARCCRSPCQPSCSRPRSSRTRSPAAQAAGRSVRPGLPHDLRLGCAAVILLAAGLVWAAVRTGSSAAPSPGSPPASARRLHPGPCRRPSPRPSAIPSSRSPTGCPTPATMWMPGRPVAEPVAEAGRAVTALVRDGRRIAVVSHTARCPTWSASSAPPSGSRWRTSGCRPRRSPSSTSCEPPASASWRPATPNAAGWNATCTMAPSSACWPSPTTSGSPAPRPRPTATRPPDRCSPRRPTRPRRPWRSYGTSPTGSTRRSWPRQASRLPWRPWPTRLPYRSRSTTRPRALPGCGGDRRLPPGRRGLGRRRRPGRQPRHRQHMQDSGRLVVTVEDDGTDRTSAMVQLADRVGALDG